MLTAIFAAAAGISLTTGNAAWGIAFAVCAALDVARQLYVGFADGSRK